MMMMMLKTTTMTAMPTTMKKVTSHLFSIKILNIYGEKEF